MVVSGAAGNFLAEVNSLSPNGFKVVVDIDLIGTFNVMRAGFEHLSPGASVLNITAPQATIPMRYQAHVCAAKAGVDQLTRVSALEWGRRSIRVNAIAPGPISGTEGLGRLTPTDDLGGDTAVKMVPLGRLGTKQDIASLAMFLSSPAASFISGAVIPCDGGGAIDSVKSGIEEAGRSVGPRRLPIGRLGLVGHGPASCRDPDRPESRHRPLCGCRVFRPLSTSIVSQVTMDVSESFFAGGLPCPI